MQSRWGTHGDHPVIVLTPASVAEIWVETVRAFKGDDDYEYVLTVPAESVQHLMLLLLETTFNTHSPMIFSRVQKLCTRHGLKTTKSDWN